MTEFEPTDWQARLAERTAAYLAQRDRRKAERQEFQRRRAYGLAQRHAQKLALNRAEALAAQQNPGGQMPDQPPCCAGLSEPCPQHRQAARIAWNDGPRKRSAGGTRVIGEEGRARPAPEPEETR